MIRREGQSQASCSLTASHWVLGPHAETPGQILPARLRIISAVPLLPLPYPSSCLSLPPDMAHMCRTTKFRTSALQLADRCLVVGLMLIECEHQPLLRTTESLNLTSQGGRSLGWVCLPYAQRLGAYESLHIHCLILSTNSETRQELSLIPLCISSERLI